MALQAVACRAIFYAIMVPMNAIYGKPNNYPAGLEFNYAVWSPGTVITLCNVPWDATYKDVVRFESQDKLNEYLDTRTGPIVSFDKATYIRAGSPIRIPLPFNDAYKFNYVRVHNPAQPVGETSGRDLYYFITDIQHLAPNTTQLVVQLDVWQTFGNSVSFGNAYVERGHIGIADSNTMYDNGRVLLTQPEGFDLGSEYSVERVYRHNLAGVKKDSTTPAYSILVTSTTRLHGNLGTTTKPVLESASGSDLEGLPNGANTYYFSTITSFYQALRVWSKAPWAAQGIISIMAVPGGSVYNAKRDSVSAGGENATVYIVAPTDDNDVSPVTPSRTVLDKDKPWREDVAAVKLNGRFRNLLKFLTYPYCVVELTTYTGTPLVLKPECMSEKNIVVTELTHLAQPSPRIVFVPYAYNKGNGQLEKTATVDSADDGAEFLDLQTGIYNFPMFSIVNNSYLSYMASNANSIAYAHSSADWSQQKAMTANQLSYDQTSAGMQLNSSLNRLNNDTAIAQTGLANSTAASKWALDAATGFLDGTIGGARAGGAPGAVAGMAGGAARAATSGAGRAIDMHAANASTNINVAAANNRTDQVNANTAYVRDTNKDYADFAAKGDYAQAIGAINAKVQDAKMIQPTTSGQVGGDAFNLAMHKWQLVAKVKMIQGGAMRNIGEYWLRYGYAINRYVNIQNDLMVMEKFTYWKLRELYLTSAYCPENFKQTIRGIFEKGVTVWASPEYIGTIDIADNEPIRKARINVSE